MDYPKEKDIKNQEKRHENMTTKNERKERHRSKANT